jgi:L-threonylcarbamoyladenylate synthase
MKRVAKIDSHAPEQDVIKRAAKILRSGGLVAFPTETVYGLGANALDARAVRSIFTAKERPDWDPLIVHVEDTAMARSLAKTLPPIFDALTDRFWPGPLTLVVEKAAHVPDEVTAGRPTVALRRPRHVVAAALLAAAKLPIAAPSANRFGRPSPTCAEHVLQDLKGRVDLILDAGPTPLGIESTVLDLTQSPPVILRPGGVSREELKPVIDWVAVSPGISDEVAQKGLAGPGMTVRHYAPRARVELIDGSVAETIAALNNRVEELNREGKTFYILSSHGDTNRYAQTLFAQMREADSQNVEVILGVLPPPDGVGLAVRDRWRRAAGLGGNP